MPVSTAARGPVGLALLDPDDGVDLRDLGQQVGRHWIAGVERVVVDEDRQPRGSRDVGEVPAEACGCQSEVEGRNQDRRVGPRLRRVADQPGIRLDAWVIGAMDDTAQLHICRIAC
jgi:hypothetical protein